MPDEVRPRVVVVDDEQSVRELVEIGLSQDGFDVRSAADGPGALALIRQWEPEAILLDVMMPMIDGLSLIPLIRRVSHAPIIILTARSSVGDRVAGLRAGADDYIVKPFELVELTERLHAALRRPFSRAASNCATPTSTSISRRTPYAAPAGTSSSRRANSI